MTTSTRWPSFAASTPVPICASETLATRWAFRELLERDAAGIVMLDLSWVGGLSEAQQDRDDGRDATICRWRRTTAPGRSC